MEKLRQNHQDAERRWLRNAMSGGSRRSLVRCPAQSLQRVYRPGRWTARRQTNENRCADFRRCEFADGSARMIMADAFALIRSAGPLVGFIFMHVHFTRRRVMMMLPNSHRCSDMSNAMRVRRRRGHGERNRHDEQGQSRQQVSRGRHRRMTMALAANGQGEESCGARR